MATTEPKKPGRPRKYIDNAEKMRIFRQTEKVRISSLNSEIISLRNEIDSLKTQLEQSKNGSNSYVMDFNNDKTALELIEFINIKDKNRGKLIRKSFFKLFKETLYYFHHFINQK